MTISRDKGELVCACDDCGDQEFGGTLEFGEFIAELKGKNWKIRRDESGDYFHLCPTCVSQ